jgi:hypothetical protein
MNKASNARLVEASNEVISWQCVSNFIFIHRLIVGFGDVANLRNQKTEHTL